MKRLASLATIVALLIVGPAPAHARRPIGSVRVFARVPAPGQPEGLAVGHDGTVYTGTFQNGKGTRGVPSAVFALSPRGRLERSYSLRGQDHSRPYGAVGIAIDARRRLYVVDRYPPRVLRIDADSGRQTTYARFRLVPPCTATSGRDCSRALNDAGPFPAVPLFLRDGTMLVSDIQQALVWRVPPGGGTPHVLFTARALDGPYGPNKLALSPDGRMLYITQSLGSDGTGGIFALDIENLRHPGHLRRVWTSATGAGPDGLAVARSGNLYVMLSTGNQVVKLDRTGRELARYPATPLQNQQQTIPFDGASSLVFDGRDLLAANQSFLLGDPASWAILDVYAGETGRPLNHPFAKKRAHRRRASGQRPHRTGVHRRAAPRRSAWHPVAEQFHGNVPDNAAPTPGPDGKFRADDIAEVSDPLRGEGGAVFHSIVEAAGSGLKAQMHGHVYFLDGALNVSLQLDLGGQASPNTVTVDGTATVTGGTGAYRRARGTLRVQGQQNIITYGWSATATGRLRY